MLSEKDMEQASAQLTSFRAAQTTLSEVLENYTTLIEDYKRLKSDYEEERDSRERYKQMARGQERNPFVLVLIDGDGYIFDDDLISSGPEGGGRAAHLLNETVKDSLRNHGLENCRIMVRIYANLSGLSKTLSKVKLAGAEKRSLGPFVANFNRSNELFDFVDAGELKENADYKIRAMFRLFAENPQCRHIYWAGCHDVGYISELVPYTGSRDRITLVRSSNFHPEFSKLGMRIENFPNIFRPTPLDIFAQQPSKALPMRTTEPSAVSTNDAANVCKFYQRGQCTYGNACRNLHIPKSAANGTQSGYAGMSGPSERSNDWRQNNGGNTSGTPFRMSNIAKNDNDFFTGSRAPSGVAALNADDFSTSLPHPEDIPLGHVPVNKNQHRLDFYMAPASLEDWAAFNGRAARHKLCNNYHLTGVCSNGLDCQYDHGPISPGVKQCLQHVARSLPCSRRGACRLTNCSQGHICQRPDCKHRGGKTFCKVPFAAHNQDLHVAQYVPGATQTNAPEEVNEAYTIKSGKDSSPSLSEKAAHGEGAVVESDDEKQDGAPLDVNDTDLVD